MGVLKRQTAVEVDEDLDKGVAGYEKSLENKQQIEVLAQNIEDLTIETSYEQYEEMKAAGTLKEDALYVIPEWTQTPIDTFVMEITLEEYMRKKEEGTLSGGVLYIVTEEEEDND